MKTINFNDIPLYSFGTSTQIAGVIWSGENKIFITTLPNKKENFDDLSVMQLTLQEWQTLLRQTDILEVEMFAQDETGITKTIVRKSQRQIDQRIQWACFARDNYACRYCGRLNTMLNPVPLTVDHIILWEKGGITAIENLLTACRTCNSDRGNMVYEVWINSSDYKTRSNSLPESIKQLNLAIVSQLPYLESLKSAQKKSR